MKKIVGFLLVLLLMSCSSKYIIRYVYEPGDESIKSKNVLEKTLYGRYNFYYSDKDFELYFDINPYEVGLLIKNISRDTIRIIWDKAYLETDFNGKQKFKLIHTNREQEYISLKDSTVKNYEKLKAIKRLQEEGRSYVIQPTIVLPGDIFEDRIINSEKKDFYPYIIKKKKLFDSTTKELMNKNIILYLPIKENDKLKELSFTIKVKDMYMVKKGY